MWGREVAFKTLRRCVIAFIGLVPAVGAAEGHINISLKAADPESPGGRVVVSITNTGDAPTPIMVWHTPFAESGGRLPGAIFKATDAEGHEVPYRGTWAYVGRLTMRAFRTIAPGETLTKEIDLTNEYRFAPNQIYQIDYTLNLTHEPDPDVVSSAERRTFIRSSQEKATANPVTIFFGDTIAVKQEETTDQDLICTSDQTLIIDNARIEAGKRLRAGEKFMRERYVLYFDNGVERYRFSPHPRYTRWFGTHDASEPPLFEPGWGENNNARAYETVMATAMRSRDGKLTPRCGCPGWGPDTPAHAEVGTRYTMYFCDLFFKLPRFDAFASQAGAVMHEYTHYDAFYPGTADYGYGQLYAERAAAEDRTTAVKNADNFEFFFTDTTPYQE